MERHLGSGHPYIPLTTLEQGQSSGRLVISRPPRLRAGHPYTPLSAPEEDRTQGSPSHHREPPGPLSFSGPPRSVRAHTYAPLAVPEENASPARIPLPRPSFSRPPCGVPGTYWCNLLLALFGTVLFCPVGVLSVLCCVWGILHHRRYPRAAREYCILGCGLWVLAVGVGIQAWALVHEGVMRVPGWDRGGCEEQSGGLYPSTCGEDPGTLFNKFIL